MSDTPQPEQEWAELDKILNQFIVFGQKQEPFSCARCGAQTDDNTQKFCWCTDRDTSNRFDHPNWINNINYPRYAKAKGIALDSLTHFIKGETDRARLDELFLWFPELTGTAQVDTLQISLRSLKNRVAELTTHTKPPKEVQKP